MKATHFMSISLPKRRYRCRLEEVGPLAQMTRSSFVTDQTDFGKASPDFAGPGFLAEYDARYAKLEMLVPTANRRATDAEVTKTMNRVAKDLREPLNWLDLRLGRAAKKTPGLTVAPTAFGLGKIRSAVASRDMEKLDGGLKGLLELLGVNGDQLKAQGHTAADTKTFADARAAISGFNVTQNDNDNASLVLTEQNVTAANAMWEVLDEVLDAGRLMYKQTQPRKAVAYTLARLKKRMRAEREGGEAPVG